MIRTQLEEKCTDYLRPEDKEFVISITQGFEELGYIHNGLEKGYMWGKYMIIFRKAGVKSKKCTQEFTYRRNISFCGCILAMFSNMPIIF